jgi:dTDP-4-dehydrorhamnose reductase
MELWGGIECTVNRVGDTFHDQLVMSGHDRRPTDLERIAELGIETLRYPVIWERTAPADLAEADWRWADERLLALRDLRIRPIATLLHHGSGPRHTDLLDPGFPQKLADYALAVAHRYPWIDHYTPINEPMTTARFSTLYGHWYPHHTSDASFVMALLNECAGIAAAMRAIRTVNPAPRLVLTDDFGRVHSTPQMRYQADFENERRWLAIDLITGRVDSVHPLWSYLESVGVSLEQLRTFHEEPTPPDLIGIDYYLTSERFLDERIERYPAWTHGGNGRDRYADVEAVRVRAEGIDGAGETIRDVWNRYRLPVAITEAHLAGQPDDQVAWLLDIWHEAATTDKEGVDLRAVTAWALFGSFDWHCLVTRCEGHYEPSAYDVRQAPMSATPLASIIQMIARGEMHTADTRSSGWWQRDDRLAYPPVVTSG